MAWAFTRIWLHGVWRYLWKRRRSEVHVFFLSVNIEYKENNIGLCIHILLTLNNYYDEKIVLSVVSIMMTSILSFHLVSCNNDNDDMNEKPQVDVDEALVARILQDSVIQAVDLGLSVKWANMNLGAHKTLDFGDYYASAIIGHHP